MFNWPFFVLLFGSGVLTFESRAFHPTLTGERLGVFPSWMLNPVILLIISAFNLVAFLSSFAFFVYGFFILPWYTVLICGIAEQIASGAFVGLFMSRVRTRSGPLVALLAAYGIALATTIWYLGFASLTAHP
jgi:hypothetical protein